MGASIPDPSISRHAMRTVPAHMHSLHQKDSSVLSLAGDYDHLFSGSQGQDIFVWDRRTFQLKTTLEGHTGPVLALEVCRQKKWLFSSSGDSTVRVWSTSTLAPLYVIVPHGGTDAGDIFSLTFSPCLSTLFFGCQNTSLQWLDLSHPEQLPISLPERRPPSKRDRFFESGARSGTRTPSYYADRQTSLNLHVLTHATEPRVLHVPAENVIASAHYGYIYSMALLPSPHLTASDPTREDGAVELLTGSGDEDVKLWLCTQEGGPVLQHTFHAGEGGGVLSLVARSGTVYAGCQAGFVKVWDLETRTLVRTIIAQENVDVLSLSMVDSDLYGCSANGMVQRWSASFECTASWKAHDGIVLSSIIACDPDDVSCASAEAYSACEPSVLHKLALVTGANDSTIKLWSVERPLCPPESEPSAATGSQEDTLLYALEKFVAIPSLSGCAERREDCRQAAIWLKKCLSQLGAETQLLPTSVGGEDEEGGNPLVLATFRGTGGEKQRPRVLFYGHYDVIDAPAQRGWDSDPFTLSGRDGYLYGRGVTDNKGPILACATAASDLLARRKLDLDLVMLVEGEEEVGSPGFCDAVRRHKDQIGHVDAVLVSNSYWIGECTPCITYGLRGVVHATVEISSQRADVHSGVDGGAVSEPMIEMIKLLSTLTSGQKVLLPGFYDTVRPITSRELEQFELLSKMTGEPVARLCARWREPSLSVHGLQVSGPGNATVIPARVKATVSLRVVPDQDTDTIARSLVEHLQLNFRALQTSNQLSVTIERKADWWLGDLDSDWFLALESAIKDEWGVTPLRIREGGSIPPIPFLEKEFGCNALQLPLGQSTDQAHLANERISLNNLRRGKSVFERFFTRVAQFESKAT
ncbi:glutathione degradosome [Exidia glandulosa HHB12029]|uniref:Glutathione degradosome n=1 Tax=Exidia glandulosa HHB12029 TaxID=1314781 RepID=A0A165P3C2_EXIGL|nr:glutathione degradosome [Exidia glandulosa HHB12029]